MRNIIILSLAIVIGMRVGSAEDISHIKIVSWYQSITDYRAFSRTIDDVITHLRETNTEFVFRAFWRWNAIPDECPIGDAECELAGRSYAHLENAIIEIKSELPDIIICGGIAFERINAQERNPITGETFDRDETWAMALNPGEYGIDYWGTPPESKVNFQEDRANLLGFAPPGPYDTLTAYAYYPDILNPDFQQLLISWAKKQIDCGVDAIWVDMLFAQARIFAAVTGDPHYYAVEESYEAACAIVDSIHEYGSSIGRNIYVGVWNNFLEIDTTYYAPPDVDFIVVMIWESELWDTTLYAARWNAFVDKVKSFMGDTILIIPFMDEATVSWEDQPLGIFSQYYDSETQRNMLMYMDSFFFEISQSDSVPITFMYPIHGGWMGNNATILAFDSFNVYDALAPEFNTYETIVELSNHKLEIVEETFFQPTTYSLTAFPNPFNSSVVITVSDGRGLARQTLTNIKVYDLRGNVVYAPSSVPSSSGHLLPEGEGQILPSPTGRGTEGEGIKSTFIWQPDKSIASGIYFVKVRTKYGLPKTKPIIYLK